MPSELETLPGEPGHEHTLDTLIAAPRGPGGPGEPDEDATRAANASASLAEDRTVLAPSARSSAGSAQARSGPGPGVPDPAGPGARVGRYVLIAEVGRGAMGVVYAAYDPKLDRKLAVKLLIDRDLADRSLREAQALARLNHPNVVKVYDVGEHDERAFIAMEFVVGRPLGDWRAQTEPSLPILLDVFRKAALGLAAAHEAGLVHRDFKPEKSSPPQGHLGGR